MRVLFILAVICLLALTANVSQRRHAEDYLSVVIARRRHQGEVWPRPAQHCRWECNWVKSHSGPVGVYCEMNPEFNRAGGWRRVIGIDMTEEDTDSPEGLELITSPRRMCGRPFCEAGCSSTTFSLHGLSYSRVCGKIIGYQFDSSDAFDPYRRNDALTIDDGYVDGVSITYGNYPKNYIWILACSCPRWCSHLFRVATQMSQGHSKSLSL